MGGIMYGETRSISTEFFEPWAIACLKVWEGLVIKVIGEFGFWKFHVRRFSLISWIET